MIAETKESLNGLEFQLGLMSPGHTCGVFIGLSVDRCGKSSTEQAALFSHVRRTLSLPWIAECERQFGWSEDISAGQTSHFTRCCKRLPKIQTRTREQERVWGGAMNGNKQN